MARNPGMAALALALALALGPFGATIAEAQTLGTFRWQLQPYCNVVNVTVTQSGGLYTLDGYDDQCGAPTRASVVGTAVPNPNGSITLGFNIVTTPDGTPVHVQTALSLATLGGPWSDSAGHTGTLVYTPGAGTGGAPRPAPITTLAPGSITSSTILDGSVGAIDVNAAEVQRRVGSACPSGQLMTGVNQDGTVACQAVTSGSGGDITGVAAGTGLSGGGTTGDLTLQANLAQIQARVTSACPANETIRAINADGTVVCDVDNDSGGDITAVVAGTGLSGGGQTGAVTLTVNYTGSTGVSPSAARSDHSHAIGNAPSLNTAVGANALANHTIGNRNTALGAGALSANTSSASNTAVGADANPQGGCSNTAVGSSALSQASTTQNTAVGANALRVAQSGSNTAVGAFTLDELISGDGNVALGGAALGFLTAGFNNLAVGRSAGINLTSGSENIYVGNVGSVGDDGAIRIGAALKQTTFFAAGIRGVTTNNNNAQAVVIDNLGQLGTISSSRKTKFDIADLDMSVTSALQRLRPVQFRYLKPFADSSTPIQYGLIAEEVQEVLPELVALDEDGQPASVKYHILPSLLLAEVQRLSRELAALQSEFAALAAARR